MRTDVLQKSYFCSIALMGFHKIKPLFNFLFLFAFTTTAPVLNFILIYTDCVLILTGFLALVLMRGSPLTVRML